MDAVEIDAWLEPRGVYSCIDQFWLWPPLSPFIIAGCWLDECEPVGGRAHAFVFVLFGANGGRFAKL